MVAAAKPNYMGLDEALALCRNGVRVRDDNMSPGWHIEWLPSSKGSRGEKVAGAFYCYNPHVKSLTYQFLPNDGHQASKKWRVVA